MYISLLCIDGWLTDCLGLQRRENGRNGEPCAEIHSATEWRAQTGRYVQFARADRRHRLATRSRPRLKPQTRNVYVYDRFNVLLIKTSEWYETWRTLSLPGSFSVCVFSFLFCFDFPYYYYHYYYYYYFVCLVFLIFPPHFLRDRHYIIIECAIPTSPLVLLLWRLWWRVHFFFLLIGWRISIQWIQFHQKQPFQQQQQQQQKGKEKEETFFFTRHNLTLLLIGLLCANE